MLDLQRVAGWIAERKPGHSLPQSLYNDAEAFAFDMEAIFARSWIMVGFESELPKAGAWMAVDVGPWPVVITRARDGVIRAFHNSCRHRGAKICPTGKGASPRLICPYHRWAYEMSGELAHASRMGDDFDPAQHGLVPVHAESVGGVLYVCLADEPPPIADFQRDFAPLIAPHRLAESKVAFESVIVEQANWKLVMENGRECYHCAQAHPELAQSFPVGATAHFDYGEDRRQEDFISRLEACGLPIGPIEGDWWQAIRFTLNDGFKSMTIDGSHSVKKLMCELGDGDIGSLRWAVEPHGFAHATADQVFMFSVVPVGPRETKVVSKWLVHKDAVEGVDYRVEDLAHLWTQTNLQDRALAENNQLGVDSLGYRPGPYSADAEALVIRFVDWYEAKARAYLQDRARSPPRRLTPKRPAAMPPSDDGEPKLHPDSIAVGHGYDPASAWGAAKPPIVLTSTYVYPSAQAAKDLHAVFFDGAEGTGEPAYIYSRLGHPNLRMLEARMAALDRAEDCAGFNSGMAAISTLAWALVRPGDSVVYSRPIYSGSDNLLNTVLPGFGVAVEGVVDACDEAAIRAAAEAAMARGRLALFMLESPANPTASIVDIALVRRIADEIGERVGRRPLISVDNTFLGPLLQNPLEHGADLTVTSLTKYCGGHSDLLAGSISGSQELVAKLKALRTVLGTHLEPFNSWLVLRSLESLSVRTERAVKNAALVAAFLRDHPKVDGLTYLGFLPEGSPRRAVYDRQCGGAGSTFSFTVKGDEPEAFRLLDKLRLTKLAVSLGGSETLICHPATTTHYNVPRERRLSSGITDGTMRLSIGLEHSDDLIADLTRGLDAV